MFNLSKSARIKKTADKLYRLIIQQARRKEFYQDFGVADTVDGRFDMILLLSYILFKRLKNKTKDSQELSQAIFDLMFSDMDQNLREIGIGDIGVSHRIKDMVKAFYGRVNAYDSALLHEDPNHLAEALKRNLYRKTNAKKSQITSLAHYVLLELKSLESQKIEQIVNGQLYYTVPQKHLE